jgi:hypothetical protein
LERKHSEEWQSRASRTLNSTACFSMAYVILTYLLWLTTGLTGMLYKFDSIVYYYGIKFILNDHAWSRQKVAMVYSSGTLIMLILAMLAVFLFRRMKKIRTMLNVFFLWIFIIGISIFMSQFIIAAFGLYHYNSIFYQGLAVSFAWLRIPLSVVYVLNALVVLFIIYMGVNCARPFLIFSFSFSKVNNLARRRKYFFEIALVPYILGSLITIVAIFPKDITAKNILILLASTHLIYLGVIGCILGIGWLSLSYIEMAKQDLARYKSLQIPNVIVILFMIISWATIYVTFRGLYLSN